MGGSANPSADATDFGKIELVLSFVAFVTIILSLEKSIVNEYNRMRDA